MCRWSLTLVLVCHVILQVVTGQSLLALDSTLTQLSYSHVKLVPIYQTHYIWVTRIPVRINSINNAVRPFPPIVWLALLVTLTVISVMLLATQIVYKKISHPGLLKPDVPITDFFLLPFSAFFEPDVMPWFSRDTGLLILYLLEASST